jgi:oxygen-independent coproporphyrinogen-3 oxidase
VANNTKYIKSIEEGILPSEEEILSKEDIYNEYIMTGLRTKKGVSLEKVKDEFGKDFLEYLLKQAKIHLQNKLLIQENQTLKISKKGKFLSDGIAADLFLVNLD